MKEKIHAIMDNPLARLFLIFLIALVSMSILVPSTFLTVANFRSMSVQLPELGFLSIAAAMVLISGGIDLSVTGTAIFAGITSALILKKCGGSEAALGIVIVAIACALAIGVLCGALNAILVTKLQIAPMLATLGTMNLFTGLGIVLSEGSAIAGFPKTFQKIGNGSVFGIPVPLILFVLAISFMAFLLNRTKYGFNLYMYGTNPTASFYSRVNNTKVVFVTYILSGVISSIAGIIIVSRINTAKADYGSSYGLQALLVAVLGGISPSGGSGKALGLLLSIVTLQVISSGFNLLHVNSFIKDLTWGALLVIIMLWNQKRNGKKE
mgnify:CR=1 FL=1